MITIEDGLIHHLGNDAGVTALVAQDRIFHLRLPQTVAMPAITLQRITSPRLQAHDEGSGGLAYPRIQIDCWGSTYASAKAVSDAVRAAIKGFRGTFGAGMNTVTVGACLMEDERPEAYPDEEINRVSCDYRIWHQE